MDSKTILNMTDHTNLSIKATEDDIRRLCEEAKEFDMASVCVAPCYVELAHEALKDSNVKVCTVIGFPNGYSTCETKTFEAADAIIFGADEIDMVINTTDVINGNFEKITKEIDKVKLICSNCHKFWIKHIEKREITLKVIVESSLWDDETLKRLCKCVTDGGADYIKTSTGFNVEGATVHAVTIMKENIGPNVKIKAAGGIRSLKQAEELISAGADRIGASSLVKCYKAENK